MAGGGRFGGPRRAIVPVAWGGLAVQLAPGAIEHDRSPGCAKTSRSGRVTKSNHLKEGLNDDEAGTDRRDCGENGRK
ncbi:hypothetical protein BCAR13_410050 [Paraburkholderia caribensis]|nr:hypothetical protein BCAR13_410050 [Paraburkholderia caribensis]